MIPLCYAHERRRGVVRGPARVQLQVVLSTGTVELHQSQSSLAERPYTAINAILLRSLGCGHFLANVNSRSRSLYAIARPSVCRL